jgi:acyl carrier protein
VTTISPRDLRLADIAQQVEKIWQDILRAPHGSRDATFFELQGQSISAVRIIARIEDELGIGVDVGILFDDPDLYTFTHEVLSQADQDSGIVR